MKAAMIHSLAIKVSVISFKQSRLEKNLDCGITSKVHQILIKKEVYHENPFVYLNWFTTSHFLICFSLILHLITWHPGHYSILEVALFGLWMLKASWSVDLGLLQVTSVTPVIWRLILITSYNMITYLPLFRSQIVTILHLTTDVAIIEGMHSTLSETASAALVTITEILWFWQVWKKTGV